ncbi:hypothetical protein H6F67_12765 [Microcoleus sp. FACHB-1515]|uniref:hypothetical protein n=1 Tax=Cyanophyceae TaxID=3028117 RepID=UPI0016841E13|nr:hypothetical protein [Microcoleus sp. FACHB-1515]MBD2090727.1 hypothetical protein [Microcoleus sp. FACHB-1515]
MNRPKRSISQLRPETIVFLFFLGITIAIWVLRGLALLAFLPGWIIWLLIFLTFGAGIVEFLQRTKR